MRKRSNQGLDKQQTSTNFKSWHEELFWIFLGFIHLKVGFFTVLLLENNFSKISFADFVLVYEEGEKAPPPKHLEYRQKFLGNLAKSQLEFEEVRIVP